MTFYKRLGIYYNDLQNGWSVVDGYYFIGTYKTFSGAKCAITCYLRD